MLLVEIPWASQVWALPFLSALAPSERYAARRGRRHKKITEWAWQLLLVLRRCYPQREIVAVADRAYASLKLLDRCRKLSNPITFVTRLRLDAALYERGPSTAPGPENRESAPQGREIAQPFCGGPRPYHRLEADRDRQLVRERAPYDRDRF
jgi:DDE superfamily endonuclease